MMKVFSAVRNVRICLKSSTKERFCNAVGLIFLHLLGTLTINKDQNITQSRGAILESPMLILAIQLWNITMPAY